MDVLVTTFVCVFGIGLSLWHGTRNIQTANTVGRKNERLDDRGYETGIDNVIRILEKNGVIEDHRSMIHSMIILITAKDTSDYNLDLLIPDNDSEYLVYFGKQYIDRFATNPTKLDCFLAGVIEREVEHIRLGGRIPVQDVYEIRKNIDTFYYKNL